MTNYTRPNDPDHEDSPQEWLEGALVFARALSLLLDDGEGIIVDVPEDSDIDFVGAKKLIVYSLNNMIHIENKDGNLKEGTVVRIIDGDKLKN